MKSITLLLLIVAGIVTGVNCQNAPKKNEKQFELNDLTFYSSACNGTCPDISMNLTPSRKIQLIKIIYEKKGQVDTVHSGGFKGVLNEADYNKIVELLSKINWDTLTFPDIQCCDLPVVSILISYNNTNRNFKSMSPPEEARELIDYLTTFLVNVSLPRYDKPMDFEVALPPPIKQ